METASDLRLEERILGGRTTKPQNIPQYICCLIKNKFRSWEIV